MTFQDLNEIAQVLLTFFLWIVIISAITNLAFTAHHKREAAKAQVEYWTKKTEQLNTAKPDSKKIAEAINAEMKRTRGNDRA